MDGVALGRRHIDHRAGCAGNMVCTQSSGQRLCHGTCIVIIILLLLLILLLIVIVIEKRLRARLRVGVRARKYGGN